MPKSDYWGVTRLLTVWGLRASGTSFKTGLTASTGGDDGEDDEWQAKAYVESTKGFLAARPVLRHVYVEFKTIKDFRLTDPNETEAHALWRRNWKADDLPIGTLPSRVLSQFEHNLLTRIRSHPFRPTHKAPEQDEIPMSEENRAILEKGLVLRGMFAHNV